MITFTGERAQDGVAEFDFDLTVDGERVPAVIWAPDDAKGHRPLVLMGHGGSQHKKVDTLAVRARRYAREFGWATLSIDAPGHGERARPEEAEAMARDLAARVRGATPAGSGPSPIFKSMAERARRIVPEWRASLDAAQSLDFVGADGPVGYWGLSMGLVLGVPFVAAEPRITCAVFGLGGLRLKDQAFAEAARNITIPVEFTFQWDDAVAPRETGLALFDAFGSSAKTMHINPGAHGGIPEFENASWESFFLRHLGGSAGR
jgi:pimeloyl-ACP methyl ester carboxylesterase